MMAARTSRPEPRASGPHGTRPPRSGNTRRRTSPRRHEPQSHGQTTDDADRELPGTRSRGRSQALLYNEERPHSKLGWMTPRDYAGSIRGETGGHAAQPDGFARRPLATPTNEGSDPPRTLVIAG